MIPPYLISRFVTVIFVRFLPLGSPVRMSLPPASITILLKEYTEDLERTTQTKSMEA
jgi:hypothetical protein